MKIIPATYAHYCFGKDVLQRISSEKKEKIQKNIDLFNIGLHGPDILFYYRPYISNKVSKYGYSMHSISGEEFFSSAVKVCEKRGEEHLSYIYGFLCHFVLDAKSHGFVEEYVKSKGVSHTTIETEFDRFNVLKENKNPLKTTLTKHIKPNKTSARIIAEFFGFVNRNRIYRAIKSYIFYSKILSIDTPVLKWAFKLIGKSDDYGGLIMSKTADSRCEESNKELSKLYNEAVDIAVAAIENFPEFIYSDDLFKLNFDSERREKSWDSN